MDENRYGNGNPPYSLYQAEDDLWGLMDHNSKQLINQNILTKFAKP